MSTPPNLDALRSVGQLRAHNYYLPDYQRGYRWKEQQVADLLNDIHEFDPEQQSFYCLQPLVVRPREDEANCYELIDGQQRLTTLLLITLYIEKTLSDHLPELPFQLNYPTRPKTEEFLNELRKQDLDQLELSQQNIDFHYISKALITIHDWFTTRSDVPELVESFRDKLHSHCKVIWYEPEGKSSSDIFARINVGKIPLTSEELIKARLLQSGNFLGEPENLRLKQLEIANEWDRIESALQSDSLWYFLNPKGKDPSSRIKLIFQLYTDIWKEEDQYEVYRKFLTQTKNQNLSEVWAEIKSIYQKLQEWHEDRELYHKVGYLLAIGESLPDLFKEAQVTPSKKQFKLNLDQRMSKTLPTIALNELEYKDKGVKKVLLLHNVLTHITEKQSARFPFHKYKMGSWDVEHIHSLSDKPPTKETHRKAWLKDAIPHLKEHEELSKRIKEWQLDPEKSDVFPALYRRVLDALSEGGKHEEINGLDNLSLLNEHTNRSYADALFPVKRNTIIEHEKKGIFVPVCTKNAFMKLYNEEVDQFSFWSQTDRESYFNDLEDTLTKFTNSL